MHWDTNHLDAIADARLHVLVRATDQNVRQAIAQAAIRQDLRARQLSVLSTTYSAWDISYERDASGGHWWTAVPRRPLTLELVSAGVMSRVRREDAIALASALAWQSALLQWVLESPRSPWTPPAGRLQVEQG